MVRLLNKKYNIFGKGKTLKELISDLKIPRQTKRKEVRVIEHLYNPLHLYSRLREAGISYHKARRISEDYENNTYKRIMEELKNIQPNNNL